MGTTGRWTDEAILRESARWVHVPAAGTLIEGGTFLLVHPPGGRGTSRVWRSWPARGGAEGAILDAIEEVRASGGGRLVWHTGDRVAPPFMDALLPRFGFEKTEDLEVLAFDLGDDPRPQLPRLDAPNAPVRAALVRDEAGIREAQAVESRVFPNSPPLERPEIRAYLRGVEGLVRHEPSPEVAEGDAGARTLRFVALLREETPKQERVVATAGAQVVGETVRLWGAGTLPEHRRRGAYSALVVERCRLAHSLGATLALTKANTATSAPLLRNAGFRPLASERRYALTVPGRTTAADRPKA